MRYFFGFLVSIGLVILLIILVVSGGGDSGDKSRVEQTKKPLGSYSNTDAAAILTVDGPINAAQEHDQLRITVTKYQVTYEKIRGYDGSVQDLRTYGNTEKSYASFLRSLSYAGFTKGDDNKELRDERGYCPLGNRYIFELKQGGRDIQRYWSTSCNKEKTYLGQRNLTVELFQKQIPDFSKLDNRLYL